MLRSVKRSVNLHEGVGQAARDNRKDCALLLDLVHAAWLRVEADHGFIAAAGEQLAVDLFRAADGFVVVCAGSISAMRAALERHAYLVFGVSLLEGGIHEDAHQHDNSNANDPGHFVRSFWHARLIDDEILTASALIRMFLQLAATADLVLDMAAQMGGEVFEA